MTDRAGVLPFTSLVGQDAMKQALLVNAVNPAIGGVLIRGDKGTAKSTAVRGLAALLIEFWDQADAVSGNQPDGKTRMQVDSFQPNLVRLATDTERIDTFELGGKAVRTIALAVLVESGEIKADVTIENLLQFVRHL